MIEINVFIMLLVRKKIILHIQHDISVHVFFLFVTIISFSKKKTIQLFLAILIFDNYTTNFGKHANQTKKVTALFLSLHLNLSCYQKKNSQNCHLFFASKYNIGELNVSCFADINHHHIMILNCDIF
jgi:hypothetical protein